MIDTREYMAVGAAMITASVAFADATLSLSSDLGIGPLYRGDVFTVAVSMSDLGVTQAAGFVAFVAFDRFEVVFVEGAYTDEPFGLHHVDPIVSVDGVVTLASGIDGDAGQLPTSDDAELALLTFEALFGGFQETTGCVTSIGFADQDPPSMLTDPKGQQITPLLLEDLPPLPAPRLSLSADYGEIPVEAGDYIVVTLSMQICDGSEAAGFQAFLDFDGTALEFISGAYTSEPFGLPLIDTIFADDGRIALAAGIDQASGEAPFTGSADLALLTFMSVSGGCVAPVAFAEHEPPSRISDPFGEPIEPLGFDDVPEVVCPEDVVRDCIVDVLDLLAVLAAWDQTSGPADINQDGIVDVLDLLMVLQAWGPCI